MDPLYIDIGPGAIDGLAAGGKFRVVAGATYDWRPSQTCGNDGYQYFGVHTWNTSSGQWENYAVILVGHLSNSFVDGQIVIHETTTRASAAVGVIAQNTGRCWPEHVHVEYSNYSGNGSHSRSYDWDGPFNPDDTNTTPQCKRTGTETDPTGCNAYIRGQDVIGYVGGNKTSYAKLNNPYNNAFPGF